MIHHFTSQSETELKETAVYYEKKSEGLGDDFIDEIEQAVDRIVMFPEAWGRVDEKYMHCHLRRFPYTLIYTMMNDADIVIVAVFHQKRNPNSWRKS